MDVAFRPELAMKSALAPVSLSRKFVADFKRVVEWKRNRNTYVIKGTPTRAYSDSSTTAGASVLLANGESEGVPPSKESVPTDS